MKKNFAKKKIKNTETSINKAILLTSPHII